MEEKNKLMASVSLFPRVGYSCWEGGRERKKEKEVRIVEEKERWKERSCTPFKDYWTTTPILSASLRSILR